MEERCVMETGLPIGWKDWTIQLHYVSLCSVTEVVTIICTECLILC